MDGVRGEGFKGGTEAGKQTILRVPFVRVLHRGVFPKSVRTTVYSERALPLSGKWEILYTGAVLGACFSEANQSVSTRRARSDWLSGVVWPAHVTTARCLRSYTLQL